MVIPVHLALFAHMVRGWEWYRRHYRKSVDRRYRPEVSGGIIQSKEPRAPAVRSRRATGLESTSSPKGTNIREKSNRGKDLTEVAGGEEIEGDFDRLIIFSMIELKLLTPTERTAPSTAHSPSGSGGREQLYQLTHDIMVPPLRRWLTRWPATTRRGRASLCLEENIRVDAKSGNRFLPTALEWARIVMLTSPADDLQHNRR